MGSYGAIFKRMKLVHYIIIFLALVLGIFVFYEIVTFRTTSSSITNNEYATAVSSAAYDAAKTIKTENYEAGRGVWRTQNDRLKTIGTFYSSIARSFGYNAEIGEIYMKEKTPFLALVDIDGFYISYNASFDDYGNSVVPDAYDTPDVLTEINTWSKAYGSTNIRYYLTDYIDVTAGNVVYSGRREAVVSELSRNGLLVSQISFLADETQFTEERNYIIVKRLEETINYIINTQMIAVNPYLTGYNVTLVKAEGEDWQRMINNPTVMAFMQGEQNVVNGNVLNEYAFAAGELTASKMYFIEGPFYYALDGNQVVKTTTSVITNGGDPVVSTVYTHNGVPVTNIYTSMEECAALGAVPAPGEY